MFFYEGIMQNWGTLYRREDVQEPAVAQFQPDQITLTTKGIFPLQKNRIKEIFDAPFAQKTKDALNQEPAATIESLTVNGQLPLLCFGFLSSSQYPGLAYSFVLYRPENSGNTYLVPTYGDKAFDVSDVFRNIH